MAVDLAVSGLASGFDWKAVVEQLVQVERTPQARLRNQQATLNSQKGAVSSLVTELETLQSRVEALQKASLYTNQVATSSDEDVATASVDSSTPRGSYALDIIALATNASYRGTTGIGGGITTSDSVTSSSAGFASTVTSGTFTVNGTVITIDGSQSLDDLMASMETAIGGAATVTYNAGTDKIEIDGAGTNVVLGSSADSSNFLKASRLFTNGTDQVDSTGQLGGLSLTGTASAELGVTDGTININGVDISLLASDTVSDTLNKITNSSAEVTASYDPVNDRFVLTNKKTGNIGFALTSGTSNFLTASGLIGGTLNAGQNAEFTINGSGSMYSTTNTFDSDSHGIQGLEISGLTTGTSTIEVAKDTASVKAAITSFVTQYSKVQSFVDTQTASSTDADGKITAGLLANDSTVISIASELRHRTLSDGSSSLNLIKRLESLGYKSSGFSNKLDLDDEAALDDALDDSMDEIYTLFNDADDGIATRVQAYAESLVGDDGSLVNHVDTFTTQSKAIDTQVANMEKQVQAEKQRLTAGFVAMEEAQAKVNQQMQFLSQRFK